MAVVGEFPTFRNVTRMPVNPMDRATIVSIYPEPIIEVKPTIYPGYFEIRAVTEPDDFDLLVVGPSSWWKEMEDGQPFLEIPCSSIQVADSVIKDYVNGALGCDMSETMPGLFFIPGEWDKVNIYGYKDSHGKTFSDLLARAQVKQKNWFMELVRIADIMWARTNGNPLSISRNARLAAEKLGLQKNWMQDFKSIELSNCPACGSMINLNFPVCSNCKNVINKEKATELGLIFAQ